MRAATVVQVLRDLFYVSLPVLFYLRSLLNCCSIDAKTDAVFNEFLRHDASFDADVCHGRCLAVQRFRRNFHPVVCPTRADPSSPPTVRSPPSTVPERRLRRLGATSGGRRRSRRGSDGVDSPTRASAFRRPSPHDSIEEEEVFLPPAAAAPAAADDVQSMEADRRRYELCDANNHDVPPGPVSVSVSVYNGRRTTVIPTICVREEIETDT